MNLRFGVLTISDRSSRGERPDMSGPALVEYINSRGWSVQISGIVPDVLDEISTTLAGWCSRGDVDIALTTGGTGFSPRDVTPEATRAVMDREAPGLAEVIRLESLKKTRHAMLSRGVAGIREKMVIINLPGNPGGAVDSLDSVADVLEHAVMLLRGDGNAEEGHASG